MDDYSHYIWSFPIRNKSEVHGLFVNFQNYVYTHFYLPIRFLQCDNGCEFDNTRNREFFLHHGILPRFSCPYTSSQNGKAERSLRTINDILRTLLIQASMPPKFWVEALRHATYLLNICPTTKCPKFSPYKSLFLASPPYDSLRTFGCLCFPNLSATTPHKLSPRSLPCVFLGHSESHKGYRFFDLQNSRVILSRHVTFDETVFPFHSHSSPDFFRPTFCHQKHQPQLSSDRCAWPAWSCSRGLVPARHHILSGIRTLSSSQSLHRTRC